MIKTHFDHSKPLAVMGTIQFAAAIHKVRSELGDIFPSLLIPKCKPLSPGEVLGCTSPKLPDEIQEYVFVADGRFHLESAMIHNPTKQAFRYNPYDKTMTKEGYEHEVMRSARKEAIDVAARAGTVGLILGTLGRQGNPAIMQRLKTKLLAAGKRVVIVLMSEIFPQKLALMPQVDAWVQVACPRLSVDWGSAFQKPLLNPYEAEVALATAQWAAVYPMDYYAAGSGSWTNYHKPETGSSAEQSDAGVVIHNTVRSAASRAGSCACAGEGDATAGSGCCSPAGGAQRCKQEMVPQ
jgi:2-(3-amino-3-carboxypropyl)histidine synthase